MGTNDHADKNLICLSLSHVVFQETETIVLQYFGCGGFRLIFSSVKADDANSHLSPVLICLRIIALRYYSQINLLFDVRDRVS